MDVKDLQILHEDNHVIVVVKPQNVPSQADSSHDKDMLTLVKEYVKRKYDKKGEAFIGLVHRLDRPTGGVMVFAKTSKAASRLSESIREGDLEKTYLAVVNGSLPENEGTLVNYLKKNSITNVVYTVPEATEGAKRAELQYQVVENKGKYNLVKVNLITGRGHQIRVQLSNAGAVICGDVKYGNHEPCKLALWASVLKFEHPTTKQRMTFIAYPPEEETPWKSFNVDKALRVF